jgi:hypothetical protein
MEAGRVDRNGLGVAPGREGYGKMGATGVRSHPIMLLNEAISSGSPGSGRSGYAALLRVILAISAVLTIGVVAPGARAETPASLVRYAGVFSYAGTKEQGLAIVDKAWDVALADVNIFMRLLVKNAVKNQLVDKILIELSPGKIAVKLGDFEKVTAEIGKTENFKGADPKQSGKVTYEFDGGKITETFVGDQGTFTNILELTPDGKTLHRSVTIKNDRLPKPVRYQLDYVRK